MPSGLGAIWRWNGAISSGQKGANFDFLHPNTTKQTVALLTKVDFRPSVGPNSAPNTDNFPDELFEENAAQDRNRMDREKGVGGYRS